MITIDLSILNQKGTPMFYSDIFAARPPFGIAGRIFISTDTKEFYRDTGTAWELLGGPGTGTITGGGTATQVAFFNSATSIAGNNDLYWDNVNSRLGIGNNNPAVNLDIHGNNATIQIDGRSTSSAFVQFVTQGVSKWRIGNLSPSNYFQIYDNANSLERLKIENTGLFTLTGNVNNNATKTAVSNDGWYGLYTDEVVSIPASTTFTGGNSFGSITGNNKMTFAGNATMPNSAVPAGILSSNVFTFSNALTTLTINQATGTRAISAVTAFNQVNTIFGSTITHLAGFQVLAPYSQNGTLTATNYFGLLINASDERAGFTITNKWGIYQEGSNDRNYLNGTTLIGTNVDTLSGAKLQVTGAATFTGNVTGNSFIKVGGTSTQYLMADGSTSTLTSPITGSGTTNYLPKFTGSTSLGNSQIFDNGTNVGIGTASPTTLLSLAGSASTTFGLSISASGWNNARHRLTIPTSGDTSLWSWNYNGSAIDSASYGTSTISVGNGVLTFSTNTTNTAPTERLRITSGGDVGIGLTSPVARLQVVGANGAGLRIDQGNYNYYGAFTHQWLNSGFTSTFMTLDNSGRLGIGTTSPSVALEVAGASNLSTRIRAAKTSSGTIEIGADRDTFGSPYISAITNSNLDFFTNDTHRMRITSGGRVLIGTTTDNTIDLLQVAGSGRFKAGNGNQLYIDNAGERFTQLHWMNNGTAKGAIWADNTTSLFEIYGYSGIGLTFSTNATERMRITSGGEVYIAGTADQGAYNLQVNGTGVWGAGAYVNGSDIRLKENISPIKTALEYVNKMNPISFKYKESYSKDQNIQPGFIAQELKELFKDEIWVNGIVSEGTDYLNVAYQNIIPLLTKAIQELKTELDSLKNN